MRIQNLLLVCSSLWLLLTGCQIDRVGVYTNLKHSTKEGYLYHHVYRVRAVSCFNIFPSSETIFSTPSDVYGMLTGFVDEEKILELQKTLQDNPEARKRYMIVEPGMIFRVVEMKIYWLSPSGISDINAEVLNGPLKGKMIDVSIFGRSRPQKDDSRILYTDIVEDLGQLSNEELKKKGLLAE